MKTVEPNLQVEQVFLRKPCCIWWMDRSHNILGCNIETCAAFKSHSPQEILGKNILEIAREKDLSEFKSSLIHDSDERIMKNGHNGIPVLQIKSMIPHYITESPMKQLGAKQSILNKSGEVIGLVCVSLFDHDIGPEFKKNLELLDIEHFKINSSKGAIQLGFKEIYEITPCSLWWMDRQHAYLGCNEVCLDVCEVKSEQEFIGENIYDACKRKGMSKSTAKNIYDLDEFIMQNGISSFNIENIIAQGSQPSLRQWAAKRAIFNNNHEIIGLVGAGLYNGIFGDEKKLRNNSHLR